MIPLSELDTRKAAIVEHVEGGPGFQRRLASLGIRTGKSIRRVASEPLRGPIIVEVDGTRVAIGRGMAMKVFVVVNN